MGGGARGLVISSPPSPAHEPRLAVHLRDGHPVHLRVGGCALPAIRQRRRRRGAAAGCCCCCCACGAGGTIVLCGGCRDVCADGVVEAVAALGRRWRTPMRMARTRACPKLAGLGARVWWRGGSHIFGFPTATPQHNCDAECSVVTST